MSGLESEEQLEEKGGKSKSSCAKSEHDDQE